jgi:hypothetical protein
MSSDVKKLLILFVLLCIPVTAAAVFAGTHKGYLTAYYIGGGVVIVVARAIFWIRWRRQRLARRQANLG